MKTPQNDTPKMPLVWFSTIRGLSNPDRTMDRLYYGKVYRIPRDVKDAETERIAIEEREMNALHDRVINASCTDGGTPATAGLSNLALVASGSVGFESSRISPTYGDDKINNGSIGISTPDFNDATRPWINATADPGGWVGVKLATSRDLDRYKSIKFSIMSFPHRAKLPDSDLLPQLKTTNCMRIVAI